MMIVLILICHRTRLSAHFGKAALRIGTSLVGAAMRTRLRAVVVKVGEQAKGKKEPREIGRCRG